jgi:hypothetical protein
MNHLSPSQGFGVYLAIEGVLIALVVWLRYPIGRWLARRRRRNRLAYAERVRGSIRADNMAELVPRTVFGRSETQRPSPWDENRDG